MIITPPTLEPTMTHDYYTPNTGVYCETTWLLHPQHWSLPWHMIITPPTLEPTVEPHDYYTPNTGAYRGTTWLLHPQHWSLPWNHFSSLPVSGLMTDLRSFSSVWNQLTTASRLGGRGGRDLRLSSRSCRFLSITALDLTVQNRGWIRAHVCIMSIIFRHKW